MLVIKASVDRDRRPGRFLLTGSTRLLSTPRLADTLAGRMEIIGLWPLSMGEVAGRLESFVSSSLAGTPWQRPTTDWGRHDYVGAVCAGGFPEASTRIGRRRDAWFDAYATTVLERLSTDVAEIERRGSMPALLRLCATRTATELNVSRLANDIAIPPRTLSSYLAHLSTVFLIELVPAWSTNLSSKVVHRPKLVVVDSGLAANLVGVDETSLGRPDALFGQLLETFVIGELRKQLGWSSPRATMSHFRDRDGAEVDVVLEARDGRVAGIEVKAARSVTQSDFRGLRFLQRRLGDRFASGVVLYTGNDVIPFGDGLTALPISALWDDGQH